VPTVGKPTGPTVKEEEVQLKRLELGPFYFMLRKHSLYIIEFLSSVFQEGN
jgi:hypothetical protein